MAAYPRINSPIQALPVELLSSIFSLAVHDLGQSKSPSSWESCRAPLAIASVNRKWRAIAQSTPVLWTNICISLDLIEDLSAEDNDYYPVLNALPVKSYLELSRNQPLNILIDARDPDWDFVEPEIPQHEDHCDYDYVAPFTPSNVQSAISCLLPHLHRWRSLDLLTDSWAPMDLALRQIQPFIIAFGAPALETLTLMRCNDFVSYSPEFYPQHLKTPVLFDLSERQSGLSANLLPSLKKLTLRGVHVNWSGLCHILSANAESSLQELELGSHSVEVRPTFPEFYQLLSAAPGLRTLNITGSGPAIPLEDGEPAVDLSLEIEGFKRLPLSNLEHLTLGYRTDYENQFVLEMMDAPNVRSLALEDGNHPGEPDPIDASPLLYYIASQNLNQSNVIHSQLDEQQPEDRTTTAGARIPHRTCDGECPRIVAVEDKSVAFPQLESIRLKRVRACPAQLHFFLSSMRHVRELEMVDMSISQLQALVPHLTVKGAVPPCPKLESVTVRGCEALSVKNVISRVKPVVDQRAFKGFSLQNIDVHCDSGEDEEPASLTTSFTINKAGTVSVSVQREVLYEQDEEDGDVDGDCLSKELDPHRPGGEFNDPTFDAYVHFSRAISAH